MNPHEYARARQDRDEDRGEALVHGLWVSEQGRDDEADRGLDDYEKWLGGVA